MPDFALIESDTDVLLRITRCSGCRPPVSNNDPTPEDAPSLPSVAITAGLPKLVTLGLFNGSLGAGSGFGISRPRHINTASAILNLCAVPSVVMACDDLRALGK